MVKIRLEMSFGSKGVFDIPICDFKFAASSAANLIMGGRSQVTLDRPHTEKGHANPFVDLSVFQVVDQI